MNTHKQTAQKCDPVMTFVVMLAFALSILCLVAFVGIHEIMPAVQHFMSTITQPQTN